MARQTEREELLAAWRALTGDAGGEGWRTIPVAIGGACKIYAGRHFPGNEEALLVRFSSARVPQTDQLPQGRGFLVTRANVADGGASCDWIALCRQIAGSMDLFTMMAVDIVGTLEELRSSSDDGLMRAFLSRIKAWQEFMRRGEDGVLNSAEEVGLVGELVFLQELVAAGLPAVVAVDAWRGPFDGIQDFALGNGAVEVKATALPSEFTATVTSLGQLDDSLIHPLFLAGVRLTLTSAGKTLPNIVGEIRGLLEREPVALADFDNRLLRAGYLEAVADRYTRRFSRDNVRLFAIRDEFPRLSRANVAIEIRKVEYDINLDLVRAESIMLTDALSQLGVA